MKWLVAIVCLPVAGFCVFGFLATFEPGVANALVFRLAYAVVGLACVFGIVFPLISRKAN